MLYRLESIVCTCRALLFIPASPVTSPHTLCAKTRFRETTEIGGAEREDSEKTVRETKEGPEEGEGKAF